MFYTQPSFTSFEPLCAGLLRCCCCCRGGGAKTRQMPHMPCQRINRRRSMRDICVGSSNRIRIRIRMQERWAHIGDGPSAAKKNSSRKLRQLASRRGEVIRSGGDGAGKLRAWRSSRRKRSMESQSLESDLRFAAAGLGLCVAFVGFASGFSGFPAMHRTRRHSGHGAN